MKKLTAIVLLLLTVSLSACTGSDDVSSVKEENPASAVSSEEAVDLAGIPFKFESVKDPAPINEGNSTYKALQFNIEASDISGIKASDRINALEDIVSALDPDLISFNESCSGWDSELMNSKYFNGTYTFVTRITYDKVLYRTDRFTAERQGYLSLKGGANRGLSYVVLHDNVTAKQFVVISTHWNHSSSYTTEIADNIREENAQSMIKYVHEFERVYPNAVMIMMGDYNCHTPAQQEDYNQNMISMFGSEEKAKEFMGKTALKTFEDATKYKNGADLTESFTPQFTNDQSHKSWEIDHIYFDPDCTRVLSYSYNIDDIKVRKSENVKRSNGVSDHPPLYSEFVITK